MENCITLSERNIAYVSWSDSDYKISRSVDIAAAKNQTSSNIAHHYFDTNAL